MSEKSKIVILAAGQGKRMQSALPKALVPFRGRPMIEYAVEAVKSSGIDGRPVIVVAPDNNSAISAALDGYDCEYALQDKPLGTGHALKCALPLIPDNIARVACLYSDHPLVTADTIIRLENQCAGEITVTTTEIPDFADWRQSFLMWGRIMRENGKITAIVEYRDATPAVKDLKELNVGFYCFDFIWLKNNISLLEPANAQREYYLTDLVRIAQRQGLEINSFAIPPEEAVGINTREELQNIENMLKSRKSL